MSKFRTEKISLHDREFGQIIGKSLRELREILGLTQVEVARRLNIGQAAISKIESRGDIQVSSLKRYIDAIGGSLCVNAGFQQNRNSSEQLAFPIFGDDLAQSQRDVVLSIRPHYSEKIFEGKKTVELRRRFPTSAPKGMVAYIYSTSPVRAMTGTAKISSVVKLPVSEIWKRFNKMAQIEKSDFDEYFAGLKEGFALKISNAQPFARPLDLHELRNRFGFEPPQSFLYATPSLRTALKHEYTNVSD